MVCGLWAKEVSNHNLTDPFPMANNNSPFGLLPLGLFASPSTPSFSFIERKIASANTNVIAKGDPVIDLNTGYIDRVSGTPVTSAASLYAGVFWGCSYLSIAQGRRVWSQYWPGGDAADDPVAQLIPLMGATPGLFVIQALLTPVAFADIGRNGQFSYAAPTTAGLYRKSGVTLDTTTNTTATFPLRIVGLLSQYSASGAPGTDDASDYNVAVVSFNGLQVTGI